MDTRRMLAVRLMNAANLIEAAIDRYQFDEEEEEIIAEGLVEIQDITDALRDLAEEGDAGEVLAKARASDPSCACEECTCECDDERPPLPADAATDVQGSAIGDDGPGPEMIMVSLAQYQAMIATIARLRAAQGADAIRASLDDPQHLLRTMGLIR